MDAVLIDVLEESRTVGHLGPPPIADQLHHASAFLHALTDVVGPTEAHSRPQCRIADLGTGGGLPGLALAAWLPEAELHLVEVRQRRAEFLRAAVRRLGWAERVQVHEARAEDVGRAALRGSCDVVVARSFGPPAVTAECAAPLLTHRGLLVVSEPPEVTNPRWPVEGLTTLSLEMAEISPSATNIANLAAFRMVGEVDDRYPRRQGVPEKRPLWTVD